MTTSCSCDSLESYVHRRTLDDYRSLAGLPVEEGHVEGAIRQHSRLFDTRAVHAAFDRYEDGHGLERLRAARRLGVQLDGFLSRESAPVIDALHSYERQATAAVGDQPLSFREFPGRIANEPSRDKRESLARSYETLVDGSAGSRVRVWEERYSALEQLNRGSYLDIYASLNGIDFDWLCGAATELLGATEGEFARAVDIYRPAVDGTRSELAWHDIAALIRGQQWDRWFTAHRLGPRLEAFATHLLGAPPESVGVTLDLETRRHKAPRAFCAPLSVPGDIRLVACPKGGHRDFEEAFHELGHVLHFSNTPRELAWELRVLPDDVVAEMHAYTIAALLRSEQHLHLALGLPPDVASEYAAFATFIELYMVRRYCAKVLFEVELHRGGNVHQADSMFQSWTQSALGLVYPPGWALMELDPGLYASQYLLAWLLWAEYDRNLCRHGGDDWTLSASGMREATTNWTMTATDSMKRFSHRLGVDRPRVDVLCDALHKRSH